MNTTKKWIISSVVTFITGFAIVFVAQIDTISLASFKDGALLGLLFTAIRAGVKGILELFLTTYGTKG